MSAKMEIELLPWTVPNFVTAKPPLKRREEGWHPAPTYHISTVDTKVLSRLCDDFRVAIFEKAGKIDPYELSLHKARAEVKTK